MKYVKMALFFCLIVACGKEEALKKEVAKIPVQIGVERFDRVFADLTPANLASVKSEFPFLFPARYADSVWLRKAKDTLQLEINREVEKVFPDFSEEKEELTTLLQYIKYYFPEVTAPKVITVTSDVDYHNKVVLSGDLLIISLDTYLGSDHYFYEGIQAYLKSNFTKTQLMPDIATMYAKQLVELPKNRTFLANMVYYGKELYLKSLFLPSYTDAQKIAYAPEKYVWAVANEDEIWRYFIDKQLLYSTKSELSTRFLFPGPFSKFYLQEIDQEAPDRIGQFIGWRIVASYMKNNSVSLRQLLLADAETIFTTSKYKPAR